MRFLSHLFLGMSFAALFMLGCERHQFDKTKILHGDHGHHGEHAGDHGDGHSDAKHSAEDGHHGNQKEKEKQPEKKKEEPRDVGL